MLYTYKCESCKKKEQVEIPISEDLPEIVECKHCQGDMKRYLKDDLPLAVKIPDHMKAGNTEINLNTMHREQKRFY